MRDMTELRGERSASAGNENFDPSSPNNAAERTMPKRTRQVLVRRTVRKPA